ncbi:MAG: LamG domain-containing protein [Armatimonadetes bacterium]|nr:LamG domain-containing protein [Armatimonadota bacterium]
MRRLLALLLCAAPALALPDGLLFHLGFDKLNTNADFARGDGHSSMTRNLELQPAAGIRGAGLLQQPGERLSFAIAGNFDTRRGTYSVWVKPLNWDGHNGKFHHFFVATPSPAYTMLLYLYPIGDEAVFNYISVNPKTPAEAVWRAGSPVDILKRGEWTHLVSTWDEHAVRLYANGRPAGDGRVSAPLPQLDTGTFTICPIDYWRNATWGDPNEQTVCDEVRLFDHALTAEEVLDLYALDLPGGLADLKPALALKLEPRFSAKRIVATVAPAHLDAAWQARLPQAKLSLTLKDPAGAEVLRHDGPLGDGRFEAVLAAWRDGDFVAEAALSAGGAQLTGHATLNKPPTPWLHEPALDWKADTVSAPWRPLAVRGNRVDFWDGWIQFEGAFPTQEYTAAGAGLLTAPIRLVGAEAATWSAPAVAEAKPERVSLAGTGKLGAFTAAYQSLVEFDGLIRCDVTLTPPAGGSELDSLTLEIPLVAGNSVFYRNPACQPWDREMLDEPTFLPYGWLGSDERGLSWFMESEANQVRAAGQPAATLRREGDSVVVRLHLVGQKVTVTQPLTYTFGFEATPVRPVPADLYGHYLASGPQFKGSNEFVYGWLPQISALNARLIADDPDAQRKLVEGWRAQGKHAISYSCVQCTASASPEYRFLGAEWNQPYGATFSGYKRPDTKESYSMVPVCTRSSFADFLVWCADQHLKNDWGDGVYTDIDAIFACDNALHGCGYTDAFGHTGRTWPIYAHRALSRRLYETCHQYGRPYYAHAHSLWYAPFNAFCDGWCPGEQYSTSVMGKPAFYMTDIPDRVWRSEFSTATTGVPTFLLPEMGRLAGEGVLKDRGPSETCIVAAMTYGVPLWAGSINQQVVEEVWAVQQAFGIDKARFTPYWRRKEFTQTEPELLVSYWRRDDTWLVVVSNWTAEPKTAELGLDGAKLQVVWPAAGEESAGRVKLTVPGYRGVLVRASR